MTSKERELLRKADGEWEMKDSQGHVSVDFEDNTLSGSINVFNHEGEIADIDHIDTKNNKIHLVVEGVYDEDGMDGKLVLEPHKKDQTYIEGEYDIHDDDIEFDANRVQRYRY
ncbi:argG [Acrasis kona]|uniref:ArgG n=1 Tax=Acrasis kona TaxID=1008807 RepID=A0AAW2YH67_9EUKA